ATLPDYMVPQHFVRLDAIPLLPNGKVDRKGLPSPIRFAPAPDAPAPATTPDNPLQAQVLAAMRQVLGRPDLGVDDGFFESGGHSLLAAQLCARLGRELSATVPLRQLFDTPTARRLADALRVRAVQPQGALVIPKLADSSTA